MAITRNVYIGNGTSLIYSFSFPYLNREDVRVQIDDVSQTLVTDYSFESEQTIRFVNAPTDQSRITIFRVTNTDDLEHVFYPGSAIRAKDLNTDFTQSLFVSQESQNVSYDASEIGYLYPPELGGEYSNVQDALTEALTTGGGGGGDSSVTSVNGKIGIVELGLVDLDDVSVGSKTGPPTQLCYEGASTFTISVLSNGVSTGTITPELLKITDIIYDSSESCPTGGGRDFYIVNWLSTLGAPGSTKLQFGGPCGSVVYTWAQNFTGDSTCFTPGPSPSIEDGDVLVYDSTSLKWVAKPNSNIIGGDGINTSTDLSGDVTVEVDIADIDPGLEFNNGELTAKAATAFSLGSVKAGYGLSVDFDGTLNSTFDPSQLDGEFLSLSPFAGAQAVLSTDTTEFLGKVSSESTTELDPGNTLITKDYLESVNSSVTTSDTPPLNPELGDLWWDSSADSGRLYVYYSDGLVGQWVEASPAGSGGGGSGDYLPITGGELTGDLTVDGSITAASATLTDSGRQLLEAPLVLNNTNPDGYGVYLQSNGVGTFSVAANGAVFIGDLTAPASAISLFPDGGITAQGDRFRFGQYVFDSSTTSGVGIDDGAITSQRALSSGIGGRGIAHRYGKDIVFEVLNDGSITVAGRAIFGSSSNNPSNDNNAIVAYNDAASVAPTIYAKNFNDSGAVFKGSDTSSVTSTIMADGSAQFAGVLGVRSETFPSGNATEIHPNGLVKIGNPSVDGPVSVFEIYSSDVFSPAGKNVEIFTDGSAEFAGSIELGNGALALYPTGFSYQESGAYFGDDVLVRDGTTTNITLAKDGSAVFAGPVKIGGTDDKHEMSIYEEGTWVPTIGSWFSIRQSSGKYTKIGNVVNVCGEMVVECIDYSATNASVTFNLPFAVDSGNGGGFPLTIQQGGPEFGAVTGSSNSQKIYMSIKATALTTPYQYITCGLVSTTYYPTGVGVTILFNFSYTTSE